MHDLLFARQNNLTVPDLVRYAGELGLDDQRLADDLRAGTHAQTIRDHVRGGVGSGVDGTPTLFINARRWGQRYQLHELADAIDEALSGAGETGDPH